VRYILAIVNGPSWEWNFDKEFSSFEELCSFVNSNDVLRGWTSICVTILPN